MRVNNACDSPVHSEERRPGCGQRKPRISNARQAAGPLSPPLQRWRGQPGEPRRSPRSGCGPRPFPSLRPSVPAGSSLGSHQFLPPVVNNFPALRDQTLENRNLRLSLMNTLNPSVQLCSNPPRLAFALVLPTQHRSGIGKLREREPAGSQARRDAAPPRQRSSTSCATAQRSTFLLSFAAGSCLLSAKHKASQKTNRKEITLNERRCQHSQYYVFPSSRSI